MRAIHQLCVALGLLLATPGCPSETPSSASPAPTPGSAPASVTPAPPAGPTPADRARLGALAARFADQRCDQEALAELRTLRAAHGSAFARDALLAAFTACEAPAARADLLLETLPAEPTDAQLLEVGQALFDAVRYDAAVDIFVPLADAQAPDHHLGWLAGVALLHAGRPDDALPRLEAAASTASAEESAMLRGFAHLESGDTAGAIPLLESARDAGADPRAVLPALARAYAEVGRADDAADAERAALAANASLEAHLRSKGRLSAHVTRLKQAWAAERWTEVEAAIDDAWPLAPPPLRITLQEYRVQVLAKTERAPAAQEAQAELERMKAALGGTRQ